MSSLPQTSDAAFDSEVLKSKVPTVVGFWAHWSGPCELMASAVGDLTAQFDELVKVVSLNVDENPLTSANYGIESLPTFLLFKSGSVVRKVTGGVPKTQLQELFEDAISPEN